MEIPMKLLPTGHRKHASMERMGAMFAAVLMSVIGFEITSPTPSRGNDELTPKTSNTWRSDATTADAGGDKAGASQARSAS
jgi:hypothetical protein